jgi:hypothetical protein
VTKPYVFIIASIYHQRHVIKFEIDNIPYPSQTGLL